MLARLPEVPPSRPVSFGRHRGRRADRAPPLPERATELASPLGDFWKIDLALLPIRDRFTMGPPSAAKAVELLRPRRVVPMHYNTWPLIEQDPSRFKGLVGDRAEVVILKPGESVEV